MGSKVGKVIEKCKNKSSGGISKNAGERGLETAPGLQEERKPAARQERVSLSNGGEMEIGQEKSGNTRPGGSFWS